ncbi:TPR-like protein [Polyporus arcularius HHB13444]|uniref:TPR-like protein n=1 Tax=Polyporus arcularius HHB13444 TaxID=1314778 RepID=A0A5C3PK20_9APHY|nr:TPR-like protein [Polyporus arcularius HHB13444]
MASNTPAQSSSGSPSEACVAEGTTQPQVSADMGTHDPPDIRTCLSNAEELKREGNDHFRAQRWEEALATYRSALGHLPARPHLQTRAQGRDTDLTEEDSEGLRLNDEPVEESSIRPESPAAQAPPTEVEIECAKARAVLHANIGACYLKLGEHKEVAAACTEALKDDPKYIKALQRRATANEQINSWSSLSSAQEDYKALLELLPSTSPDVVSIRRSLASLGPRVEAAQKRETSEMLDKLKGLGNSLLGNFGLSTDNFQFVPNGQGGYSMNFVQNPS